MSESCLQSEVKYARDLIDAWKDGHHSLMTFLGMNDDPAAYAYAFGCAMATLSVLCDAVERFPSTEIHHRDGNPRNNDLPNLELRDTEGSER